MPLYLCNAKSGSIPEEAKAKIAKDITDIHCDVTDAPAIFVHVFFFEDFPTPPLDGATVKLQGNIRASRTDDQKNAMAARMRQSVATHTGIDLAEVAMAITDVPASWVMEGGDIMPEPGEEDAWLEAHAAARATEVPA